MPSTNLDERAPEGGTFGIRCDFVEKTPEGADLALTGSSAKRYVLVEGIYDGILGNDLTVIKEVSFQIDNLRGKP